MRIDSSYNPFLLQSKSIKTCGGADARGRCGYREVSQKQFNAAHQDAKGPRSFSRFLVKLAELSPRLVQKQMSLLLTHLDSEVRIPCRLLPILPTRLETANTIYVWLVRPTQCACP